jgi:hypothetical protein
MIIPLICSFFKGIRNLEEFIAYAKRIGSANPLKLLGDILFCLFAACGLLFFAFLHNSGNFRVISLPVFALGLAMGRVVYATMLERIFFCVSYCIMRMTVIMLAPLRVLISFIIKVIVLLIGRIIEKSRTIFLKKYTARRFARINEDHKFGLLDDYYKEVSK